MLILKPRRAPKSSSARAPKVQAAYETLRRQQKAQYGDDVPCPLCHDIENRAFIRDMGTMLVVNNDFPYASYDGLRVTEHLMIIPKRHIGSFSEFTADEQRDYWHAYTHYHSQGYNTMTRSLTSTMRSVPAHLHTHLLRLSS